MKDERAYHVVVFGATGFTGGLIAEYLARNAPEELRWAIAGRSRDRLEGVKRLLDELRPAGDEIGIIEADVDDSASLAAMAESTHVLLSAVGPYAERGEELVRACITSGADYLDITGESDFVNRLFGEYDRMARDAGVRVVNCCGFDSIPTDLGVLYTVMRLPADEPMTIDGFVEFHGSVSGGTWRSALEYMGRWRESRGRDDGETWTKSVQPPEGRAVRLMKPSLYYESRVDGWAYPLPTIDPEVVRRSACTLDRYGPDFRYSHHWVEDRLESLALKAMGVGAVFLLSQFKPLRQRLLGLRPSGTGPSAETRAESWFKATFFGRAGDARVVTRVSGGDPGYNETAKMAGESALCLALDELSGGAGVSTPAATMGAKLIERLQRAGLRFEDLNLNALND